MASAPLDPNLEPAIRMLLDRIDRDFFKNHYVGPRIDLFLVDGVAVSFYGGSCDPANLDVSFGRPVLLPWDDLREDYVRADGRPASESAAEGPSGPAPAPPGCHRGRGGMDRDRE